MTSQGYMHFKRPLTEREQAIMDENLYSIIDIDDWWMGLPLITQLKDNTLWMSSGEYFSQAHRSELVVGYADQNDRKQIIHDLIHIKFPHLKSINFSMNNIESVQDLQFLNAPSLYYLTLSSNNISNFKSLAKCFFPHLKGLYLHQNKFVSLDWLPLLRTSGSLDFLFVQFEDNESPTMEQNLGVVFKLDARQVKKLGWSCQSSIKNYRQAKMLNQRYPKIQFNGKPIE